MFFIEFYEKLKTPKNKTEMKKLITCSAFALASFLVLQPSFIYTNSGQAPSGHTGAPGEPTCNTSGCHTGTAVNSTSNLVQLTTVGSNNLTSGYTAGTTYNLSLNVQAINKPKYGFQITALDDNGAAAGTFAITNQNGTVLQQVGGKSYVSHKNANSTAAWSFQWTAPASGNVNFYIAVNGANDNDIISGDLIFTSKYTVSTTEGLVLENGGTSSIKVLNADNHNINIFPNPLQDKIFIQYNVESSEKVSASLFNLNGQEIQTFFDEEQSKGEYNEVFNLNSNINAGLYLVRINMGDKTFFKKVLVD